MNRQFTPTSLPKKPTDMKDMISFRQLLALVFWGAFLVSCAPYPPEGPGTAPIPYAEKIENPEIEINSNSEIEKQKAANRMRLEANKKRAAKQRQQGAEPWKTEQNVGEANTDTTEVVKKDPPPLEKKKSKYPTAKPSRAGFVINPYTGKEVDVRGVPGGSLVFDPDDPNKGTNRFRVP